MRALFIKILIFIIVISLTISAGIFVYKYIQKYIFDVEKPSYATVIDVVYGSLVKLDNGKNVVMAGIDIPYKKDMLNYMPELLENPKKLLIGKKVKIELVERYRTGGFANYNVVRVYLEDGTCVNDYLLKNGLAFFDHGYFRNKDYYWELEKKAKEEKRGIWKNKNKLELLYVGSKHLEAIHYPECPEVKKIRPEDRLEYYARPPRVHWYRDTYPIGCKYCEEIKKTKPKRLK